MASMISREFVAKWADTCVDCEEKIAPGHTVVYVYEKIAHACCDDHVADPVDSLPDIVPTVCSTCWITVPCFCDPS